MDFLLIAFLTVLNGVFAMSELALASSRKARLVAMAESGDKGAAAALKLLDNPTQFLSSVQVGITSIGVLNGIVGEAAFSDDLARWLHTLGMGDKAAGYAATATVVTVITFITIIFGELVPKRLALLSPERLISRVAIPMRLLSRLAFPAVRILSFSTSLVLRLLGVRASSEPPVTEDELKVLIEQGTAAGVFDAAEQEIIHRTFRMSDRKVAALMTPRPAIAWLDLSDSAEENWRKITTSSWARFPVARGSLDAIVGVVRIHDLLTARARGELLTLEDVAQPPLLVPESTPALRALEILKQARTPMALVLDEFGGISGLFTLNDVLQAIVGDLPDHDAPAEALAVRRADGSWLLDGMLPVDEMQELLELADLPGAGDYATVAGFALRRLGQIPNVGDHFAWGGWRFEVVDMDARRVDKVLVSPLERLASTAFLE